MKLTEDQRLVVELSEGRHLVLAPPGSGKTEMLSQRILRALKNGIGPEKMLCATFTNRAAFEMRDRVETISEGMKLPEVGNLHHFCHRFLKSNGRIQPGIHVMDEVEQLDFVREVVGVLRDELRTGRADDGRRSHGLSVMGTIRGICEPMRLRLTEEVEQFFAYFEKRGISPYPDFLTAIQISRQRKCGIPTCYLRQMPPSLYELSSDGVVDAVEIAYRGLKRKFRALDFDDLINETYLFLSQHGLDDEHKFGWVQVDEVQDLNPLQWQIVRGLTAQKAVSVYFGDAEQSIFSFLGASSFHFATAVSDCKRHFFRTNFRATPVLLEILMRYSLDVLRSDWEFLPHPADYAKPNGEVRLCSGTSTNEVVIYVKRLLDQKIAENVAVLVRDNNAADNYERELKNLGYRCAKVSGIDLFATAPMRDFMSFVALFGEHPSRTAWASLVRRFADGVFTRTQARYFVRSMFASRFDPLTLFAKRSPVPMMIPLGGSRAARWTWSHRRALASLRKRLKPSVDQLSQHLGKPLGFRDFFAVFSKLAFGNAEKYSRQELWPELRMDIDSLNEIPYAKAVAHAVERIEVFLRYADHIERDDRRPWNLRWAEDSSRLTKLKEADLLIGDEKIVISTIHKAKGRQFDAVVIPDVGSVVASGNSTDNDETSRLLYVAMSRAKRHLALFGCGDGTALGAACECFAPNYVGYYLRTRHCDTMPFSAATSDATSKDWLGQWEMLAEFAARNECQMSQVNVALASSEKPIVRMALKVLRSCPETQKAIDIYLSHLDGEFGDTAIACLAGCGHFEDLVLEAIRSAVISSKYDRIRTAALFYCRRAIAASGATTDKSNLRAIAIAALYSWSGEIRHEAAAVLSDCGDARFEPIITGAFSDFRRLSSIFAPDHENTIRKILATHPAERYDTALREILFSRGKNF